MTRTRGLHALQVLAGSALLAAGSGCGNVYYAININAAESKLEQAREMGAEKQAPYEYYYAREHLHEARVQASEASYGDAATFAETAENYAQRAIDRIGAAKHGDDDSAEREKKKDKGDDDDDNSSGWSK